MTVASDITSTSNIFTSTFVRSVTSLLTPGELKLLSAIQLPVHTDDVTRVGCFLDLLYARASSDFMKQRTPEDVSDAVRGCLTVVSCISSSPSRIAMELCKTAHGTRLFVALDDCPFIISSIAERLYEAKIQLECFQHPILKVSNSPVALSYIEISNRTSEEAETVIPKVREALEALKQVVHDHEAMLVAVKASRFNNLANLQTEYGEISALEGSTFLEWLASGSFFFLGISTWRESTTREAGLGIWKAPGAYRDSLSVEVLEDLRAVAADKVHISIHKLRLSSIVHRRASLLNIILQGMPGSNTAISIVGYLTSKALACEAQDIPLLREKVRRVLALENTPPNSHDYKYVNEVIDNMPTDEALALPLGDLRTLGQLALGVFSRDDTRSATFVDVQKRRALTLIVLPPSRYSADVGSSMQAIIESHLSANPLSSEIYLDSSKKRQLRIYISTPLPFGFSGKPDLDALGRSLQRASLSWMDSFMEHLERLHHGPVEIALRFPDDYQAAIPVSEALEDYRLATSLSNDHSLAVSLLSDTPSQQRATLTFVSRGIPISLSRAVPVLENIKLEVLDANSYTFAIEAHDYTVLKCEVRAYDGEALIPQHFNLSVSPALELILQGAALDDPLNLLLRKIPISIQQISLLRGYCAFLWQTHKISTKRTMWKSLAFSPDVAHQLIRIFDIRFNPHLALTRDERASALSGAEQELQQAMRKVTDITFDRILKGLASLVKNTVRTNFYGGSKTLALKVTPQRIDHMPHPRPLFEVFVFSNTIEGTHLRSSKVSRGGIRWSERVDDYRAEVLGLMKTQRVKNVIIVPSGAKGGFIVKSLPAQPELVPAAVEAAYREYIAALLTIADNKVGDTVVSPPNCLMYDEPDPYFVVAADKGTATFSDVANAIAQNDFHFWLGDAFASGGSAGYDHKKYGITARGGWECVLRHCRDLGIDVSKPFTAVGLGDMSGDVFGNAMILTPTMSLIAAFNHKHIFIDPTPNNQAAFEERKRLFITPRTQWSDYNPSLISSGGGVFSRFDKEIAVTPEMRQALGLANEVPGTLDGEALISHILKAPVDLMWNGGIGTYVKARAESHTDVNDGANDGVRINADELRARIVGEGGNLGFTQRARIEFSLRGGRINTDAIDNSGGVDLSDHEVNLKLLFSPLVQSGAMTVESRNQILLSIAGNVVESVLQHNRDQSLMLSITAARSPLILDQYRQLIRTMHQLGFLDRNRDNLPDEQELDIRAGNKIGLTRPELAICSAAVKMWLKEGLRQSTLCNDPRLERFLLSYFPARIQDEFRSNVLSHPLRTDIIANELVGDLLPAVGIAFLPTLVGSSNATIGTSIKCVLAADLILGAGDVRRAIRELDTPGNWQNFSSLWFDMAVALRRASTWLLQTHGESMPLEEMVRLYAEKFAVLRHHTQLVFTGGELTRFEDRVRQYEQKGASRPDATLLSLYRRVILVLEVLWCAREYGQDERDVAQFVSTLLDALHINTLFRFEGALESTNRWEQELVEGSYQEIRRSISSITGRLLNKGLRTPEDLLQAISGNSYKDSICSTIAELEEGIRLKRPFQISVLPVIARQLRLLTDNM
jgi:glutamate dehydrogenase